MLHSPLHVLSRERRGKQRWNAVTRVQGQGMCDKKKLETNDRRRRLFGSTLQPHRGSELRPIGP